MIIAVFQGVVAHQMLAMVTNSFGGTFLAATDSGGRLPDNALSHFSNTRYPMPDQTDKLRRLPPTGNGSIRTDLCYFMLLSQKRVSREEIEFPLPWIDQVYNINIIIFHVSVCLKFWWALLA